MDDSYETVIAVPASHKRESISHHVDREVFLTCPSAKVAVTPSFGERLRVTASQEGKQLTSLHMVIEAGVTGLVRVHVYCQGESFLEVIVPLRPSNQRDLVLAFNPCKTVVDRSIVLQEINTEPLAP